MLPFHRGFVFKAKPHGRSDLRLASGAKATTKGFRYNQPGRVGSLLLKLIIQQFVVIPQEAIKTTRDSGNEGAAPSGLIEFFANDTSRQKIEMLRSVQVFHDLSRKELLQVDELLHQRVYEQNEIVFEEGDAGHGVFIILSGKVRVNSSRKLFEAAAAEFGPGDILGELSLFDEALRMGTAVAAERTLFVALFQAEFSSLLTRNKSIGVKVLLQISKTLSRRVRGLLLAEKGLPSL